MKLAVITGGTKGLGLELGLAFGCAGFRIIALYRDDRHAAMLASELFFAKNIQHDCIQLDISSGTFHSLPVLHAAEIVLIHNACPSFTPKPFHMVSQDDIWKIFNSVVVGHTLLTQHYLKDLMAAKRKTIINILTSAINSPIPKGFVPYVIAKNALKSLGEAMVVEYGARGLVVQNTYPGFMESDLTKHWNPAFKTAGAECPKFLADEILSRYHEGLVFPL